MKSKVLVRLIGVASTLAALLLAGGAGYIKY